MEPSLRNAAKAPDGEGNIHWMPLDNCSCTQLVSPPKSHAPQARAELSLFSAAKAAFVAKMCCTLPDSWSRTQLPSPPHSMSPHKMTEPSFFNAAKAPDGVE